MKEVPYYNPIIAPYGNVPSLSFEMEVQEQTKYVFYAKKNELIVWGSKTIVDLFPGINQITIPMGVNVNVGDYLAVCGKPLENHSSR